MMIPASAIEFHEGGNTLWVHSPQGTTTLRIKTMGKIRVERCASSPVSHSDMIVQDDITICIGSEENVDGEGI